MDQPDALRNQLLAAAADCPGRRERYEREVHAMLSDLEKKVRFERWVVAAQWIFVVLLATAFNVIGGWKHQTMTGMWFGMQGTFWFLFGTVFLLSYRFSQLKLDLLQEIKRVELAVRELKDALPQPPK